MHTSQQLKDGVSKVSRIFFLRLKYSHHALTWPKTGARSSKGLQIRPECSFTVSFASRVDLKWVWLTLQPILIAFVALIVEACLDNDNKNEAKKKKKNWNRPEITRQQRPIIKIYFLNLVAVSLKKRSLRVILIDGSVEAWLDDDNKSEAKTKKTCQFTNQIDLNLLANKDQN